MSFLFEGYKVLYTFLVLTPFWCLSIMVFCGGSASIRWQQLWHPMVLLLGRSHVELSLVARWLRWWRIFALPRSHVWNGQNKKKTCPKRKLHNLKPVLVRYQKEYSKKLLDEEQNGTEYSGWITEWIVFHWMILFLLVIYYTVCGWGDSYSVWVRSPTSLELFQLGPPKTPVFWDDCFWSCPLPLTTVDGRNPAPVDRQFIPFTRFFRSLQDFFHQQYLKMI